MTWVQGLPSTSGPTVLSWWRPGGRLRRRGPDSAAVWGGTGAQKRIGGRRYGQPDEADRGPVIDSQIQVEDMGGIGVGGYGEGGSYSGGCTG